MLSAGPVTAVGTAAEAVAGRRASRQRLRRVRRITFTANTAGPTKERSGYSAQPHAGQLRVPLGGAAGRLPDRWRPHALPGLGAARRELALDRARRAARGSSRWATACSPPRCRAAPGTDYAYVVDGARLPDPCSRWQPEGLRGPSRVLDAGAFAWTDAGWEPPALRDLVIYELHVGTFTPEGTFEAAIPHLRGLRELGVTAIEVMPVAEFPGRHGWGYDGVYISAAHSAYGGPLGFQRLVDAAHAEGLAVILDVVYNHLGASGVQAMEAFGPYLTDKYATPWGMAINLDDADSGPVREWILQSAEQWMRDFHVDGLRLDAIHALVDSNPEHIVAAIARRVHAADPRALVIAESGLNDPRSCARRARRLGLRRGLGGRLPPRAARRPDRRDATAGTRSSRTSARWPRRSTARTCTTAPTRRFRGRRFGAPADDVPPERFVVFASNHDQVGNRAFGDRLPVPARPLAALLTCLAPFTPMLFQGEEYGEPAPFLFFSDHIDEEIAAATREGRRREFAAFAEFARGGARPAGPRDVRARPSSRASGAPDGLRELYAARCSRCARELAGHPRPRPTPTARR